ncbi:MULTISPECIES: cation diffusion facilitator family transporter [Clostridium]|uniref:cation diffusion facilitator family transporter n=1 Tax=Clostridium TaxID=1485 RepID=UPI0003183E63|nr:MULTISPECIES: cation diffusion facilitator family transporter [Clostridium]KEH84954.1 cation diffusion facilitator family transporter [Clostridium novyi A str. NCTC 538]KEH87108.1 cation diffusion facilitator family transporter [Clostridium novyi A str. BKT29909]KEH88469.1 cation diffusion facilitator family transporter [Clostridium novyi A str. 4540]KEH90807.1 cation diffusion facilitator family transporter [Clostridium botulinum C/D str. It1]KEH92465.1 cation diffusion facilitator family 
MNSEERYKVGNKISKITILLNLLLAIGKTIVGFIGKSSAMISDGVHSASDVLSTICVMIGLKLAKKPEDKRHPYGHEKFEPIVAKLLALILGITAVGIGYKAIKNIILGSYATPSVIAAYAAIASILIKEWMYWYTVKGAKKIQSSALMADAWHHRSDALSSVGSLIGILGARLGYLILDPIASIVICLVIMKVAIDIYIDATNQLMDCSADNETVNEILKSILNVDGVIKVDDLKTRVHATRLYVDVEISVDKDLSVSEAHEIAEKVHNKVEITTDKVKHCMVHVNPC